MEKNVCGDIFVFAAGHQPAADHILDPFEIFGSMVPWFDVICDCSTVQSAVCLAAAPVFLFVRSTYRGRDMEKNHAEIVVYRMLAVFLNGKNRRIVRNIFSVYFFYSRFQD